MLYLPLISNVQGNQKLHAELKCKMYALSTEQWIPEMENSEGQEGI